LPAPEGDDPGIILETPVGPLAVHGGRHGVTRVRWLVEGAPEPVSGEGHALLDRARAVLTLYLLDPRLPLRGVPLAAVPATRFQWRVWRAMRAIPPGHPMTYGELASRLGSSPLAVGNAAAANPWPLRVPCHRGVGREGLGGYMGERGEGPRTRIKRWLLEQERGTGNGGGA